MKSPLLSALAALLLAAPTFAGGPSVIADEPVPAASRPAPQPHDWAGPYAGLAVGATSGDISYELSTTFDFGDGTIAGVHAGYLFQRGSLVYGGELALGVITDGGIPGFEPARYEIKRTLDFKGRLGFAADRLLVYGVLGYSSGRYSEVDGSPFEVDMDGVLYGLGVDYAVSDRLSLGLAYTARDLSGAFGGERIDANLDDLSLRVSFSF